VRFRRPQGGYLAINEMDPRRQPIVIVGAGSFAKGVVETLRDQGKWEIVGLTDKDPEPRSVAGVKVLGTDEILGRLRSEGVTHAIVTVGDNRERQRIGRNVCAQGFMLANAISPAATVSTSARLGVGLTIMAGAVVNAEAMIGNFVIVNINASVSHDCVIGEAAHVAVGAAIPGMVRIGERTLIGVGASVVPGVTIGADVVIGAGAVVVKNVPDGVTAVGVPARVRPLIAALKPKTKRT
jgi:UDP-perosamine 4-acetyltransferase